MRPKGARRETKTMDIEEEENPNIHLFSNTSYKVGASCREWSEMYNFLEPGDFSNEYQEDAYHLVEI